MKVPISGQVTGEAEAANVGHVLRSQHFGGGVWVKEFQKRFASYVGARHAIMCNSGSSANLLALSALELPKGSEVIVSAVNFPTTVNAIVQLGLVPVFVDVDPNTLNPYPAFEVFSNKTGAVIITHTLGNPCDITDIVHPIIEDCCDALGSTLRGQMVGRRGVMATTSFYPAHHITTGEGGMVTTDNPKIKKILESYRDWGRDCWCEPGCDNTCGRRFDNDYDHKYTYSRIGYNLKASDLQAAVGVAQLDRLGLFIKRRKENWAYLRSNLDDLPIEFVEASPNSDPSWFGFAFITSERNKLAKYLDAKGVGNRPIMAGNITRQPAYKDVKYRVAEKLTGADKLHEQGLWVGVWPGITDDMREYQVETIRKYFNG